MPEYISLSDVNTETDFLYEVLWKLEDEEEEKNYIVIKKVNFDEPVLILSYHANDEDYQEVDDEEYFMIHEKYMTSEYNMNE